MYDLARFRGVAAALAAATLAMAGLSLAAQAALRQRPSWLSAGDSTMEGGQDAVVGRRISGAIADLRRGKVSPDVGVVLGASAVGMAIDPAMLESSGDPRIPGRWLSLYANGANLDDLRGLAELVLGGELRPRLLLLGIHPGLLARSDHYLSDDARLDPKPLLEALAAGRIRDAKDEFLTLMAIPLNAAFPQRTRIGHNSRVLVIAAKRRMFARLGLGADSIYAPDRDPWTVRLLMADRGQKEEAPREAQGMATASVRELNEGVRFQGRLGGAVRDKGWSGRGNYSTGGYNARSLVAMVGMARERGVETAIVLLPEGSSLRATIPPEAMQCFETTLRDAFGAGAPPVIDLRASIPDDQFHDNIHPDRPGRMAATRMLVEALRGVLPATPAPPSAPGR
jgi:hypothetical protein